jgi:putative DNA primase/helicase
METRTFLSRLERVKSVSGGWMARCPSHDDGTASLSIKESDGKILLYCHAGCDTERNVLPALGLKLSDLFTDAGSQKKSNGGTIVATYDYRDATGKLIYQSVRKADPKGFYQRRPDGAGDWINDLKGVALRFPYRLPELLAAAAAASQDSASEASRLRDLDRKAPAPIAYIVEGEKDADRLRAGGLIATTNAGGAGKWPGSHSFNVHFRGFNVIIIADNDKPDKKGRRPGLSHAQDVARKVSEYAGRVTVLTERELEGLPSDGGDISDWLDKGHTLAELSRIAETSDQWIDPGETNGALSGKRPKDHELRDRWLRSSNPIAYARGDFWRYQTPREGEPTEGDGLWQVRGEWLIKREITEVMEAATPEKIDPSQALMNSIYGLARAKCAIDDRLFDADPDYLACRNGALHIPTRRLEPHARALYATTGVSYDYDPEAKAPAWEWYINWLIERLGEDTVAFLQEFAGLCATVDTSFEIAVWLFGQRGCGKSTFIEGLLAALRDRYCKLGLRDIDRSQFALVHLPGKTLAIATEQPGDFIRSLDLLDAIISGEPIDVEAKFHDVVTIKPSAKMLWAMDKLPRIPHAGSGIFRRVKVVNFGASIPEDEIKTDLKERIKTEGQGILNWLLDGLEFLRERGRFAIPRKVERSTKDFQDVNDVARAFADECLDLWSEYEGPLSRDDFEELLSRDLFAAYRGWCERNNHKAMSVTAISQEWLRLGLENHDDNGERLKGTKGRTKGLSYWNGARLKDDDQLTLP